MRLRGDDIKPEGEESLLHEQKRSDLVGRLDKLERDLQELGTNTDISPYMAEDVETNKVELDINQKNE